MIGIISATYPGHVFKQVVQAFTSPELPKRPESIKEISSIAYSDDSGHHALFMLDVPDALVSLSWLEAADLKARVWKYIKTLNVALILPELE